MRKIVGISLALSVFAVSCKTTNSSSRMKAGESNGAAFSLNSAAYANVDFDSRPSYIPKDVVVLTFDDFPNNSSNTNTVLNVLKAKNVKASFFINRKEDEVPNLDIWKAGVRRIIDEKHELGNHTAHHTDLNTLTAAQIEIEIKTVEDLVKSVGGPDLTLIRAPRGIPFQDSFWSPDTAENVVQYNKVAPVVAKHGVHVGWNMDTNDWRCSARDCVLNEVKRLMPGPGLGAHGVLLMHSINPYTAEELPRIIDYLKGAGYKFWLVEDVVKSRYNGKTSAQLKVTNGSTPVRPTPPVATNPTVTPSAPVSGAGNCSNIPAFSNDIAYPAGTKVVFENKLYTSNKLTCAGCEPVESHSFWIANGDCSASTQPAVPAQPTAPSVNPKPPVAAPAPASAECSAPAWVNGKAYKVGNSVVYNKQVFTAQNEDNPGYDPIISYWFWKAGPNCP